MNNINRIACHFEGATTEKTPENLLFAWEISLCSRNDKIVHKK